LNEHRLSRRQALGLITAAAAANVVSEPAAVGGSPKAERRLTDVRDREPVTWDQYLRDSTVPHEMIDDFLHGPSWAQFDPELGYTLQNSLVPWGIDKSKTIETFQTNGARSQFLYFGRKPRINSYGDSFTESEQVSDGETWQEYLAGHLGEPIGNFGVGGYGVYQAYRRMLREETTDHGADYVILYVWGDDQTRSLMRARWAAIYPWFKEGALKSHLFHANFWAHIEMDLTTGRFAEKESPLQTRESLYNMCDAEWMLANLHDDLAVQLIAYAGMPAFGLPGVILDLDHKNVSRLADTLGFRFDGSTDRRQQAADLLHLYGQQATNFVLDKALSFARDSHKKLLVVLNYTAWLGAEYRDEAPVPTRAYRKDQLVLDHILQRDIDYFDMNEIHRLEHEKTNDTYHAYMSQYMVNGRGHYNPRGNHLFAYSIKDKIIEMLDPKPLPYQDGEAGTVDFRGYLPGYR
jgi:hypothetical protein